jgi:hypothetical protein
MKSLPGIAAAIALAFTAAGAAAQEVPCNETTTNEVMIVFTPATMTGSARVWLFGEDGAWLKKEEHEVRDMRPAATPLVTLKAVPPGTTFLATAGSTVCVQGNGKRPTQFEPCVAWFHVDLEPKARPPLNLIVDRRAGAGPVQVALKRPRAGRGQCTRTFGDFAADVTAYHGEEISVIGLKRVDSKEVFVCTASIRGNGTVRLIADPDQNRIAETRRWTRSSAANADIAGDCKAVTLRVRK